MGLRSLMIFRKIKRLCRFDLKFRTNIVVFVNWSDRLPGLFFAGKTNGSSLSGERLPRTCC